MTSKSSKQCQSPIMKALRYSLKHSTTSSERSCSLKCHNIIQRFRIRDLQSISSWAHNRNDQWFQQQQIPIWIWRSSTDTCGRTVTGIIRRVVFSMKGSSGTHLLRNFLMEPQRRKFRTLNRLRNIPNEVIHQVQVVSLWNLELWNLLRSKFIKTTKSTL